ncbi:MAG: alpha-isopropylmalate synthase regulatory domain-containing protein, partial [Planctomycetaceae bacterium]
LGKHSGRHAFRDRIIELGYTLDDGVFQSVFDDFISLADKKKEIYDSDIAALIDNRIGDSLNHWQLVSLHTSAGTGTIPTATIELQCEGEEIRRDAATGDGPVDAVFRTLDRITDIQARLEEYEVRSVSKGKDAQGEVLVEIVVSGRHYHGKGISTDIIEASAFAYLKAINKVVADVTATADRESTVSNN